MTGRIFNDKHLEKLNNPLRLQEIPPDFLWEKLALNEPEILVDIGAGTGFFSREFSRFLKNGIVYACDISDKMLDWVEKNIVPYHSNIHPLKITAGIIPLEKNSADLIFMMNVHHEIDNHQEMLRQCMEILKPGGKILIVDWRKEIINQGGPSPEYRFTTEEVKEHLLKVKFHPTQTFTLAKHFAVIAEKR